MRPFPRALVACVLVLASAGAAPLIPPTPAGQAVAGFRLEPGLQIELVAAEPLVVDPVAFVFDERGRLYVAEGRGYPDALGGHGRTTEGRIARLEDTDGDGVFDRRTEFATGLGYVNGLAWWRGGLFVTQAPDVLFLQDTDDDGVADVRRVALTGFDDSRTAQLRVSSPSLGFDGRMYVACGLNGGKVTSPDHGARAAVTFTPRDGRFDPDTLEYEVTGGRGQYGLTWDGFGRRFICSNRHPVLHVVLEPWHLQRNPLLPATDLSQEVSRVEAEAKVYPISGAVVTAEFIPSLMAKPHTGTFTSACAVQVYGGTALPPEFQGNVFICEPAQNLVQRQVLRPAGASFRSERAAEGPEFLTSTDVWFRPVFLGSGPDGALYVADMYRREIDHPQYVPEEARPGLDFAGGKDRGRIYRITRAGLKARPLLPPETDPVAALGSADEWWRAWGFRRLLEAADPAVTPRLRAIAGSAEHAESRARALWLLERRGQLGEDDLRSALKDPAPGVREQAATLAASRPSLAVPLAGLADDPDDRVRFAAALALGGVAGAPAIRALAAVARRDGADRWARTAVLTGLAGREPEFLRALSEGGSGAPGARAAVLEQVGRLIGAGAAGDAPREFARTMLQGDPEAAVQETALLGLLEGARTQGARGGGGAKALLEDPSLAAGWDALFARVKGAGPGGVGSPARVSLLGFAPGAAAVEYLLACLAPRESLDVQLAALRALERRTEDGIPARLLERARWEAYTPGLREAVLGVVTGQARLTPALFAALESGSIRPVEIPSTRRTQLLRHADATVKAAAARAFRDLETGDRMQVYRDLRPLLASAGDAAKGREAFRRACSACHTHGGVGGKVGPDLTGVRNQPADALLLHIVVPNYEVAPAYQGLQVTTRDGRSVTGWLAGETAGSVTLRTAAGTEETVLRADLASLSASGVSLMPEGLEQTMTREELAGLIAFLKKG